MNKVLAREQPVRTTLLRVMLGVWNLLPRAPSMTPGGHTNSTVPVQEPLGKPTKPIMCRILILDDGRIAIATGSGFVLSKAVTWRT